RAQWRLEDGTLARSAWSSLLPTEAAAPPEAAPVLRGVTDLQLRTFWPDIGWVDGPAPPLGAALTVVAVTEVDQDTAGPPPAAYFSGLPLAVEIVLDTEQHGTLRVTERLQ
ncbi:type II secretion system protein GspJ, partial [Jannaschia sp.]|nr:type II secretion system protein GspJ [Jannaschia sp.]